MSETRQITITFPVGIILTHDEEGALHDVVSAICERYEAEPNSALKADEGKHAAALIGDRRP